MPHTASRALVSTRWAQQSVTNRRVSSYPTDTYKDALGRTIFTVYADGSFTQTLYSVNGQAVTIANSPLAPQDAWDRLSPPADLVIPAGGSETVSIAQRQQTNQSDASVATYSVYDASGNLVDVFQPPVVDADPNSLTHGQTIAPHWHYTYDASGNELSQTCLTPRNRWMKAARFRWTYSRSLLGTPGARSGPGTSPRRAHGLGTRSPR